MMKRLLLILAAIAVAFSASAAKPKRASAKKAPAKTVAVQKKAAVAVKPAAPVETAHRKTPYVGAISVDAATGRVLFEDKADAEAYPASVTKLMTLLLVMEDVKRGKYGFDDRVEATADAYRSEPSWVGIKVGERMSVRDLCTALMVESANDAAIVLGVHAAGSFDAFVARMNARAAELGMSRTKYFNPNGLPPNAGKRYPWKSFNVSTARDQMILARQLVKMPEVMTLTSIKTCDLIRTADGYRVAVTRRTNEPTVETVPAEGEKVVKQLRNHNNVMRMDKLKILNPDGKEAVDGLKTGYIDAGGSSIVLTGSRKGKRAIVVVLGSSSAKERDANARRLMSDALGSLAWQSHRWEDAPRTSTPTRRAAPRDNGNSALVRGRFSHKPLGAGKRNWRAVGETRTPTPNAAAPRFWVNDLEGTSTGTLLAGRPKRRGGG